MKEAYSLHLTMAQECMNIFQHNKLPDLASVEQVIAYNPLIVLTITYSSLF
jgi:syntaxin-binding protein 1